MKGWRGGAFVFLCKAALYFDIPKLSTSSSSVLPASTMPWVPQLLLFCKGVLHDLWQPFQTLRLCHLLRAVCATWQEAGY